MERYTLGRKFEGGKQGRGGEVIRREAYMSIRCMSEVSLECVRDRKSWTNVKEGSSFEGRM